VNKPVYDDDQTKDKLNPAEAKEDAATKESRAGDKNDGIKSAADKREDDLRRSASDTNGATSKKDKKKKKKAVLSRKKAIVITIFLAISGGGIFGFAVLSGPFKLIHFAEILKDHFNSLESFTDDRASRFTTFRRYVRDNGTVQSTRLASTAGKFADRMDARMDRKSGIRPIYDHSSGLMVGFEITDEHKARNLIESFEADGVEIRDSDGNATAGRLNDRSGTTNRVITLRDTPFRNRRSAIKGVMNGLDMNKIASSVGSRTLIRLSGVDFHPLRNLRRRGGEKLVDFYRRKRDQREERIKNGADGPNARRADAETDKTVDPDTGEEIDTGTPNADADSAAKGANAELDNAVDAGKKGKLPDFSKKLLTRVGGGAAAVLGAICIVRDLGNQAEEAQFANTILPMTRMGFEFIAIAAQIKAFSFNTLNLEEINYYVGLLSDKINGTEHVGAASIQFEKGLPPAGQDIDPAVKPDSVSGKPLVFRLIDTIPAVEFACGLQELPGKIPILGSIINGASDFASSIVNGVLEATIGISPESLFLSLVSWLAGEAVDVDAQGSALGNYANYGARLAANTEAQGFGGRALNTVETVELRTQQKQLAAEEKKDMPLFERYFSLGVSDSLASSFVGGVAGGSNIGASLLKNPISLFNSLLPRAHAAQTASTYDYGFSKVGFSVDEAKNPLVEDPFANAEVVEDSFDDLNDKYGKCSPIKMTLEEDDTVVSVGSYADDDIVNQFNVDEDCNDPNDEDLLRFRIYLADTMVAKSINCYEGDEASCTEIGFNGQGAGATGTSGPTGIVDVGDKGADTSNLTCPQSSLLSGESVERIGNGNSIKLCHFGSNIQVNASWAGNVSQMLGAMTNAGITYGGGGFRTAADQIRLRTVNGCPDIYTSPPSSCRVPTARPGTSNHELGLAIDFSRANGNRLCSYYGGSKGLSLCRPGASDIWDWLTANAATYNVTKLSTEAWHWSVDGH